MAIRVLHVEAGTYFGGSHKALATYLRSSTATDFEHHVLLVHPVPEFEAAVRGVCQVTTLPGAEGPGFRQPSGKVEILKFWFEQTRRIRPFLVSGGFHVVHVNNTFTFQPYTMAACRLVGVPVIAHTRNPVPESRFARLVARMPQMLVAVNAGLARSIQNWCPRDVRICYDGVELESPDLEAAYRLRRDLLGDATLLIGSVGRLEHQKGYDVLIEAASGVIAAHSEVKFVIAGDGPLRSVLEKRIAELGLQERFELCGFRSDVATFLQALDIFVCSSRYEGGPMTVAEALLMSKPVVSTAVGFVPELTCNGQRADMVPVADVAGLVAGIERAIAADCGRNGTTGNSSEAMELLDPILAARKFDALLYTLGGAVPQEECLRHDSALHRSAHD